MKRFSISKNIVVTFALIIIITISTFFLALIYLENYQSNSDYTVKKPNIYLYPCKPTHVEVKLNLKGTIISSEPDYLSGWDVLIQPNGSIEGFDY